jgi:hypothetical protein
LDRGKAHRVSLCLHLLLAEHFVAPQLAGVVAQQVVPLHDSVYGAWVGRTVFGVTITVMPAGSGDTTFNYVEVFCWVVIAATVTLVWSVADRRRPTDPRLFEALRVVLRHFLAVQLVPRQDLR